MTQTMLVIKNILSKLNITQSKFSKMINVTEASMHRWLTGERNPSIIYVEKMLDTLGMQIEIKCQPYNQKGCLFCKDLEKEDVYYECLLTQKGKVLTSNKEDQSLHISSITASFCPKCGRKLFYGINEDI